MTANGNGDPLEISEDYTKDALTQVIKENNFKTYEIDVTNASGKGENYLGVLYRVRVEGEKENGEKGKLNLIVKVPPQIALLREKFPVDSIYKREVYSYTKLLPAISKLEADFNIENDMFEYIKCYKASDEKMKEFLMFEDMCAVGFRNHDRRASLDYNHLKLAIEALSKLHAFSFAMKLKHPEEYQQLVEGAGNFTDFGEEQGYFLQLCKDRAMTVIEDRSLVEKLQNHDKDVYKCFLNYLDPKTAAPYNVLCHGDSWNNNILFKYEDSVPVDIRLLDWQLVRYSSPITDLAYLIFASTDEEVRDQHFHQLLDYYYQSLTSRLQRLETSVEDCYPETVFRDQVKRFMSFGLLMAYIVLPAVLGEAEDVPDMEELLNKETIQQSDLKFNNQQASNRFDSRMNGVVRDFFKFSLI